MDIPSLLHGCKTWTFGAHKIRILEAADMQFLGWVVGYTLLDLRQSDEEENKLYSLYTTYGRDHMLRMPNNCSAKTA
jgi:hypothetical protein